MSQRQRRLLPPPSDSPSDSPSDYDMAVESGHGHERYQDHRRGEPSRKRIAPAKPTRRGDDNDRYGTGHRDRGNRAQDADDDESEEETPNRGESKAVARRDEGHRAVKRGGGGKAKAKRREETDGEESEEESSKDGRGKALVKHSQKAKAVAKRGGGGKAKGKKRKEESSDDEEEEDANEVFVVQKFTPLSIHQLPPGYVELLISIFKCLPLKVEEWCDDGWIRLNKQNKDVDIGPLLKKSTKKDCKAWAKEIETMKNGVDVDEFLGGAAGGRQDRHPDTSISVNDTIQHFDGMHGYPNHHYSSPMPTSRYDHPSPSRRVTRPKLYNALCPDCRYFRENCGYCHWDLIERRWVCDNY